MKIISLFLIALILFSCNTYNEKEYFPDGSIKSDGAYVEIEDSDGNKIKVKHGHHFEFYPNGKRKSSVSYNKGKVINMSKFWHKNGFVSTFDSYDSLGIPHGTFMRWDTEGNLTKAGVMLRGNNVLTCIYPQKMGKKEFSENVLIHYNEDGSIKKVIIYDDKKILRELK